MGPFKAPNELAFDTDIFGELPGQPLLKSSTLSVIFESFNGPVRGLSIPLQSVPPSEDIKDDLKETTDMCRKS